MAFGVMVAGRPCNTVIFMLDDAVSLFHLLFLQVEVVYTRGTTEVHAAGGDMISKLLTLLPVMVIDGAAIKHLPCPNQDIYLGSSH
jgi:hypothetical protein